MVDKKRGLSAPFSCRLITLLGKQITLLFPDQEGKGKQLFRHYPAQPILEGTVAKLAMRQPFVLFKGLTFQKLCLPGAFRPGDH
ncbi:hypothetical protein, partial [Escherichia coli]|uniref:hypothetical protein n=1 Tax=Escherichia coli TaxID=562 RepID=UPI0025437F23